MHDSGYNAKQAQADRYAQETAAPPLAGALEDYANPLGTAPMQASCREYRKSSLREEAEKQLAFHAEQAARQDKAATFYRENPSFDLFVRLIRSGAIHI